jgi:molecular chaperone DnaK (HSP70)
MKMVLMLKMTKWHLQRLKDAAENAKKELSSAESTEINYHLFQWEVQDLFT